MKKNSFWLIAFCLLSFTGCQNLSPAPDYNNLPAFSENGNLNVVVEIPAGTNHKIEYRKDTKRFENDQENDQVRVIRFLPYPGNYGFIPSTYLDPALGGDGDALDVLLIAEHLPTGSVVEARPIAALRLSDGGEIDTKIIAVPANPEQQLIKAGDFIQFMMEYDAARLIIEEWFLNYKGLGNTELLGWENESFALEEIKKWTE